MTHVKYSSKPLLINFGAFEYLALHFGKAIETLVKYEIGLTKRSFGEIKKSNQKIKSKNIFTSHQNSKIDSNSIDPAPSLY